MIPKNSGSQVTIAQRFFWVWRPKLKKNGYQYLCAISRLIVRFLPTVVKLALKNSLNIVMPMDYRSGNIRLSVDSWIEYDKRLKSCAKEPETVQWIEQYIKPHETIYDIGANVGAYSLVVAEFLKQQCQVYAIEPSFSNFNQLSKNISLNAVSASITPLLVALADKTEVLYFNYSSIEAGQALHGLDMPGLGFIAKHRQAILCYRLDDLIHAFHFKTPNHIKLDVDGIEYQILRGAPETLKNRALRSIILETEDRRVDFNQIVQLLGEYGFQLREVHPHRNNPFHPGPYVKNCIFVRD